MCELAGVIVDYGLGQCCLYEVVGILQHNWWFCVVGCAIGIGIVFDGLGIPSIFAGDDFGVYDRGYHFFLMVGWGLMSFH